MNCAHGRGATEPDRNESYGFNTGCIMCWKQRAEAAEAEVEARKRAWKEANAEFEQMKERAEKAESAAAEMRYALETISHQYCEFEHADGYECCLSGSAVIGIADDALTSTTCGQGFLPPDKARLLCEALEALMSEQNGPPLIRRQKEWEAAMERGRKALSTVKDA